MKRGTWIIIAIGIVLILVGVVVILIFVPLGPALSLPTPTPFILPTATLISNVPATPTIMVPVSSATPTLSSNCGSGTMLIMVLGESQPPRGTDAIRLIRLDFDRRRVDVLALPSELWVNTPGLYSRGVGGTTLNQVYYQGRRLATGNDQERTVAAVNLFAGTLQANFGYAPDHYVVIKQSAFSDVVNALEGVDIILPVAVDARSEGLGYYPAGFQHLNGAMALDLFRFSGPNEWSRFDRQELIIQAIYQSLMTPQNWDRLPALAEAFHDNVFTDFSVVQALDVSCILDQPGVVFNQEQVGPELLIISGHIMSSRPELGQYIRQTVGK